VARGAQEGEKQAKASDWVKSTVKHAPFNEGREGGMKWKPEEFTMVRVTQFPKDDPMMGPAYDLMMHHRSGNARHFGYHLKAIPPEAKEFVRYWGQYSNPVAFSWEESFDYDCYVTQSNQTEIDWRELPRILKKEGRPGSVQDADIVLWCNTAMFHEPRNEDGHITNPGAPLEGWQGITRVMWAGFDLRPRNIFQGSPFYDPEAHAPGKAKH
jgi:hypothetical protein